MKKKLLFLSAICVTLALALLFTTVWPHLKPEVGLPPGKARPEARLLRVWIISDTLGASGWVTQQAAAFEKTNQGVRVHVRIAMPQDVLSEGAVLPDILLFTPGAFSDPTPLLLPIVGESAVRDALARSGRYQGMQYALPVCMAGYALLVDDAVVPGDADTLSWEALFATAKAETVRGKVRVSARYALAVPDGLAPAALWALMRDTLPDGLRCAPSGSLPLDLCTATPEKAYSDFTAKKAGALLATTRQARKFAALEAAGKGFDIRMYALPAPMTDLVLLAARAQASANSADLADAFLRQLVSPEAQQALCAHGLFGVREGLTLYDASTPLLAAVEHSLTGDTWLPNAFTWAENRTAITQQAIGALFSPHNALPDALESVR